jgi:hypothetical protein
MTKIAIVPNAAGTGTFTIEAPNSNSNRTLTLPDAAGELLTDVSSLPAANLTGNVAAARITNALNATGSAPVFACRAWVNFDGTTTTPTIRASGNVSSVTRSTTGVFIANFITAMPDANYAAPCSGDFSGSNDYEVFNTFVVSASSIGINSALDGIYTNAPDYFIAIFR